MNLPRFVTNNINYMRLERMCIRYSRPGQFRALCERNLIVGTIFLAMFWYRTGSPLRYYYAKTQPIEDLLNDPFYEKYWCKYTKPSPDAEA